MSAYCTPSILFFYCSHAPRGNASRALCVHESDTTRLNRRGASKAAFPRRAWERCRVGWERCGCIVGGGYLAILWGILN